MKVKDIANYLGRTTTSVANYCRKQRVKTNGKLFGNDTRCYNRYWSMSDLEYLSNHVGINTFEDIALRLNRTTMAVEEKASKCKMKLYDNMITLRVLAKELNKSHGTVNKWVKRGWIKCDRAYFKGLYGINPIIFLEEDIVEFLKKYYEQFNPSKIPNLFFRNVIREAYQRNHGMKYQGKVNYTAIGHYPPCKLEFSY
jgi:hypothetical protein